MISNGQIISIEMEWKLCFVASYASTLVNGFVKLLNLHNTEWNSSVSVLKRVNNYLKNDHFGNTITFFRSIYIFPIIFSQL